MRCWWSVGRTVLALAVLAGSIPGPATGQEPVRARGDSVSLRFVEADLRAVISALGPYLPKPVVAGTLPAVRVSLETPGPVPRRDVPGLLRGLLQAQGQVMAEDSLYYRVEAVPPPTPVRAAEATGPADLHVIRLRHARAADVAATIAQLYGSGAGPGSSTAGTNGTLSEELARMAAVPADRVQFMQPTPAAALGPVTVVPDERTNSLLIRARAADAEVLRAAVSELDIRPLQVMIEVLIVEARHDRSFSLGADIFVPPRSLDGGGTVGGEVVGGGIGDMVIRLLGVGKHQIDATLRAAASRGDVYIVSRPVVLTMNNAEARFLVGSQRPFVQVSRSLPTDSPSRDQVVQYKEVGTRLVVRPTINEDGYVSLVIQQEVNQATSEVQFDAPVISTREARTEVLVRGGQTVVLGGMRDHQRDHLQRGVPLLSAIPILGGLFGSADRRSSSTELFLFVTPTIIRSDDDADAVTASRLEVMEAAP